MTCLSSAFVQAVYDNVNLGEALGKLEEKIASFFAGQAVVGEPLALSLDICRFDTQIDARIVPRRTQLPNYASENGDRVSVITTIPVAVEVRKALAAGVVILDNA